MNPFPLLFNADQTDRCRNDVRWFGFIWVGLPVVILLKGICLRCCCWNERGKRSVWPEHCHYRCCWCCGWTHLSRYSSSASFALQISLVCVIGAADFSSCRRKERRIFDVIGIVSVFSVAVVGRITVMDFGWCRRSLPRGGRVEKVFHSVKHVLSEVHTWLVGSKSVAMRLLKSLLCHVCGDAYSGKGLCDCRISFFFLFHFHSLKIAYPVLDFSEI